jgi:NDP-sugar pyrophosphorylase family protein
MNADILTNINYHEFVEYHKKIKDFATLAVSDREVRENCFSMMIWF